MPFASFRNRLQLLALCGGLVLAFLAPGVAKAQYVVEVKLDKDTYLTQEAVQARVTITNRSGADVEMGGPNGGNWLTFEIKDFQGNRIPPVQLNSEEPILFKSGATISRVVPLASYFSFSEYGYYTITASVYHPLSQQYYTSDKVRAMFKDAKPMHDISFGVPPGFPDAGQIHRYSLCMIQNTDRTVLYLRILDDRTQAKLATFCMGNIIMVADPQISLDRANCLNILFMAAPHIYAHWCVDPSGKVLHRLYYKEIGSDRPKLTVVENDTIAVRGGIPYDPATINAKPPGRSVSQRPPGL